MKGDKNMKKFFEKHEFISAFLKGMCFGACMITLTEDLIGLLKQLFRRKER